jgi:hypothetical protein
MATDMTRAQRWRAFLLRTVTEVVADRLTEPTPLTRFVAMGQPILTSRQLLPIIEQAPSLNRVGVNCLENPLVDPETWSAIDLDSGTRYVMEHTKRTVEDVDLHQFVVHTFYAFVSVTERKRHRSRA